MKNRNLPLKIAAVCLMFSFGAANAQDYKSIIQSQLSAKSNFQKANLNNFEIINHDFSKSMNADVIKVQQSFNGIPVYNALATALIKDNKVNYLTENFAKNYGNAAQPNSARSASTVFASMAQNFGLKNSSEYQLLKFDDADLDGVAFAKTKLVYFLTEKGDLRLCHLFMFPEKGTSNYWDILADATTGEIVNKENLTISCTFTHGTFQHD